MFAVIKTGGKQYKVTKDYIFGIEKIDGEAGTKVEFNDVLMIGETSKPSIIGSPIVQGASVTAEIIGQMRDKKILVFKKKRRQNYRRKHGHKQELTKVKILDIKKK
ncbi:MAG UNVERIFIED_CONTAM: 50S ribosomal protein L21 [Rickettsiaceae bacterium]|jgi:large subunit ribosomal protein L21